MYGYNALLGYIDPNISQHVFSLLGPILAVLGTMGGLAVAGFLCVRRRVASYFAKASWARRVATLSVVIGVLAVVSVVVCKLL
jgi:uncharacterized membrane protein YcjF (UPF0283 family)